MRRLWARYRAHVECLAVVIAFYLVTTRLI